jgi:hypothetical protein
MRENKGERVIRYGYGRMETVNRKWRGKKKVQRVVIDDDDGWRAYP